MKKTGLTGYVYDFSADYNAIAVDDIKDIIIWLKKIIWYHKDICIVTYKNVYIH